MRLNEIRNSGMMELYLIGELDSRENRKLENYISEFPEIKKDMTEIEKALELYAQAFEVQPNPVVKPIVLATIDYLERKEKGELFAEIPILTKHSTIEHYERWLLRGDMKYPSHEPAIFAKIIGMKEGRSTMIVWLKQSAPPKAHEDEREKYLVVEGSCLIGIEEITHFLKAGDFLEIPMHKKHRIEVTSSIPCKVILERTAT